ncbi:unnamed protein product, partial [Ectocarpus sp. 12 AP-2014]
LGLISPQPLNLELTGGRQPPPDAGSMGVLNSAWTRIFPMCRFYIPHAACFRKEHHEEASCMLARSGLLLELKYRRSEQSLNQSVICAGTEHLAQPCSPSRTVN